MKLKILLVAGLGLGLLLAEPAARADTIVLNQNAYSFQGGGEFTANTASQSFVANYAPVAILNGGFETFCVQRSVYYHPGATYTFTLGDADSQGRPLTAGAAFLYSQFGAGALAGYDYFDAAARKIDAGDLQAAFWYLQGNQSGGSGYPAGGTGNPFYDLAVATLGSSQVVAPNNGQYQVQILQLWDTANQPCQNQLVLNPPAQVPEPSSLPWFTLGLTGLLVVSRRNR
jgi:hypothetical protein